MRLKLSDRDDAITQAAWSLGLAPATALRDLTSPGSNIHVFRNRLAKLQAAEYLTLSPQLAPRGGFHLYGVGPAARAPGHPPAWQPGPGQIEHTVAVAESVVALVRPGFAAPLHPTGWQGEAEMRSWAEPGAPYPDARVTWAVGDVEGCWLVELDRASESRAIWRRKLGRYLFAPGDDLVLLLTTSDVRASNIAKLAAEIGVPLLATTSRAARDELDPVVFDARTRRRRPISECR